MVAVAIKLDLVHSYCLVQLNHAVLLKRYPAKAQTVQRAAHGPNVGSSA